MPESKHIDLIEVEKLYELEEGSYLDLKHSDITPAKLSRSISAFCNTSGGELFIGIGEKTDHGPKTRYWCGFRDMEQANPIFQVLEKILPMGSDYTATFLSCNEMNEHILHIIVVKTRSIIAASDSLPYVRRNAQNLLVQDKESLRRLELDKGIVSFEDNTADVPINAITNSETVISFILNVVPIAEPDDWLLKQNLIVSNKPTVAGILLFADEPQAILPKRSAIKLYRYRTKEEEGSRDALAFDPLTIEGCAYAQIKEAVMKTKKSSRELVNWGNRDLKELAILMKRSTKS